MFVFDVDGKIHGHACVGDFSVKTAGDAVVSVKGDAGGGVNTGNTPKGVLTITPPFRARGVNNSGPLGELLVNSIKSHAAGTLCHH